MALARCCFMSRRATYSLSERWRHEICPTKKRRLQITSVKEGKPFVLVIEVGYNNKS